MSQSPDEPNRGDAEVAPQLPFFVPAERKPFLDALAELLAAHVVQRMRTEMRSGEPTEEPPRALKGHLRDDHGQKVLKPKGRLLTIQEAGDYLGISPRSLASRGWRIQNRLPAVKVGRAVRFDIQMLDRWIERHREHIPRAFMENDEA